MTELLLEYKADPKTGDGNRATPLHYAMEAHTHNMDGNELDIQIAMRLIEAGADINAVDSNLITPLHVAAANGRSRIVDFLVANGADVMAKDRNGLTAEAIARMKGHDHTADMLKAKREGILRESPDEKSVPRTLMGPADKPDLSARLRRTR